MANRDRHQPYSLEQIRLAWVEVDGILRQVAEFAGVPPRQRPPMVCPACGQRVVAKLGEVRAPHAAHQPDDVCSVASGESALHFNVKLYLAQELRKSCSLSVWRICAGDERSWRPTRCNDAVTTRWGVAAWDEVEVERAVGSRRPDVVLKRDGVVVGAVEVLVSHPISTEKAADLATEGVPWIEVKASPALYSGESPWKAADPLRIEREGPGAPWRCPSHLAPVVDSGHGSVAVASRGISAARPFRRRWKSIIHVDATRHSEAPWWVTCHCARVVELTSRGVCKLVLVGVFRYRRAGTSDRYSLVTSEPQLISSELAPRKKFLNEAFNRWLHLRAASGDVRVWTDWQSPGELGAAELEVPAIEGGDPWRGLSIRAL